MSRPMLFLLSVMVVTGQVEVRSEDPKVTLKAGDSRTFTPTKKPMLSGQVVAVAEDGRLISVELPPPKGGTPPRRVDVRVGERTEVVYHGVPQGGDTPTVGYPLVAWLDKEAPEQALRIEFGVTRFDEVKANSPITGRRYPACRLVLPPAAAVDLINRMQQIANALTQAGVVKAAAPRAEAPKAS